MFIRIKGTQHNLCTKNHRGRRDFSKGRRSSLRMVFDTIIFGLTSAHIALTSPSSSACLSPFTFRSDLWLFQEVMNLLEELLNFRLDFGNGIVGRCKTGNRNTVLVDNELGEVPFDGIN